jgi:arsenite/tail-anchored protein-transporting ATPase
MPRSKATNTADRRPSRSPTFRFVGGKGGVGKTTCAAAMGLLAARTGRPTLIVSTDPAPSLGDALEQRLTRKPRAVRGVPHLDAVEVDAAAALADWLQRRRGLLEEIALRGTWLDADDVARLLRLSLPGIDEVAGLLQIGELADSGRYEHIVVDTAPTGHLLRMLAMPAVLEGLALMFDRMQTKHRVMVEALRGAWRPDAADDLLRGLDEQAVRLGTMLRDPAQCLVAWVTLPERMAIEETTDGLGALTRHGIRVDQVIVNRMTVPPRTRCRWCDGRRSLEREAFLALERRVEAADLAIATLPAVEKEPRGIARLRGLARHLRKPPVRPARRGGRRARFTASLPPAAQPVEASAIIPRGTGVVLFGGKGGVGKTTCAAAAAIEVALSFPDVRVLLLSADPAHSVGDVLEAAVSDDPHPIAGGPPNLIVRELDAAKAFAALRHRLAEGVDDLIVRAGGSAADRQAMRDVLQLAPPGVDELAAIIDVTETLGSDGAARCDLIVVDTAPTGHALRLLEMPALVHDWVRAVMGILLKYQPVVGVGDLGAVLLRLSHGLGRLRALLGDAARTRFVVVTRAAALPRAETIRLLARLRRASIAAPVVLVNAVGAGTCPRCRAERGRQQKEVRALFTDLIRARGSKPLLLFAPAMVPAPSGCAGLRAFLAEWRQPPGQSRR